MTEEKRYPLFLDTEMVRVSREQKGLSPFPRFMGVPFIVDEWAKTAELVVKGDAFIMIEFLDPTHPVIDIRAGRVVGFISRNISTLALYEQDTNLTGRKLGVGRYLLFTQSWNVVHEAAMAKGMDSLMLLIQN